MILPDIRYLLLYIFKILFSKPKIIENDWKHRKTTLDGGNSWRKRTFLHRDPSSVRYLKGIFRTAHSGAWSNQGTLKLKWRAAAKDHWVWRYAQNKQRTLSRELKVEGGSSGERDQNWKFRKIEYRFCYVDEKAIIDYVKIERELLMEKKECRIRRNLTALPNELSSPLNQMIRN